MSTTMTAPTNGKAHKPAADSKPEPKPADAINQAIAQHTGSADATTSDNLTQRIVARYLSAADENRDTILTLGADAAELVSLTLATVKELADCQAARQRAIDGIAIAIQSARGDTVSPDEWIAVYQLAECARPIAPDIDNPALSLGALRILRKAVRRSFALNADANGITTGAREDWTIKPNHATPLRDAIAHQARGTWELTDPKGNTYTGRRTSSQLSDWYEQRAIDADRLTAEALPDGKVRDKALAALDDRQAKLDAKGQPKANTDPDAPAPIDWNRVASEMNAQTARQLAGALMASDNRDAIAIMATMLAAYISAMTPRPAAAPPIPTAPPDSQATAPTINSQVRTVHVPAA